MKRYIGIASIGLSLIFNACGQKSPEQDERVDNKQQQDTTIVSSAESKLDTIAVTDNNSNKIRIFLSFL